jgi:hypothetical protein
LLGGTRQQGFDFYRENVKRRFIEGYEKWKLRQGASEA